MRMSEALATPNSIAVSVPFTRSGTAEPMARAVTNAATRPTAQDVSDRSGQLVDRCAGTASKSIRDQNAPWSGTNLPHVSARGSGLSAAFSGGPGDGPFSEFANEPRENESMHGPEE